MTIAEVRTSWARVFLQVLAYLKVEMRSLTMLPTILDVVVEREGSWLHAKPLCNFNTQSRKDRAGLHEKRNRRRRNIFNPKTSKAVRRKRR